MSDRSPQSSVLSSPSSADEVSRVLTDFTEWLDAYGEKSWDYQSFFASPVGGRAKALYYRNRLFGTAAVAPMIFCEAFLPSARRLFHHRIRFPIADAHYAIGFALLYETTGASAYLQKAVDFLDELTRSRCHDFKEYCWGYPFDWVWRGGTIERQTPLITTTPYCYEAFLQVIELLGSDHTRQRTEDGGQTTEDPPTLGYGVAGRGQLPARRSLQLGERAEGSGQRAEDEEQRAGDWGRRKKNLLSSYEQILASIARHAANDIKDFPVSATASSCSYTPFDEGGVINAAAYRAFLLTSATQFFSNDDYWKIAERNLNFVLENQNADGSWYYAVDGVRDFVDHFHTCFVMKALTKIHALTGHKACEGALARGVEYYLKNLFAEDGLPKPFSKAPRLTVYKRELYDCAECINLCLLLRDRFPQLEMKLETVVAGVLKDWIKPDGSFRSRRLHFGWDNVPMHRWGQAQMFRSLAFYLREQRRVTSLRNAAAASASQASDERQVTSAPVPQLPVAP
jgi:hypothetical protein